MYTIEARTVNELCYLGFELLENEGQTRKSDKGSTLEVRHVSTKLTNPRNRYLNLKGRNNSIYAMIAECFWVLSGSDIVDGFLESYLHRAKLYSDDGYRWYMAYGPRLYQHNQLAGIVKYLKGSKATRQAVLSIFDPSKESFDNVLNNLGTTKVLDRSCNNLLYFAYDFGQEKLELSVMNRSNDVIFGAYSINLPEFTLIQEIVAEMIGCEPGSYIVFSNNYHTYRNDEDAKEKGNSVAQKQFENVLEKNNFEDLSCELDSNLKVDLGIIKTEPDIDKAILLLRKLFKDLVSAIHKSDYAETLKVLNEFDIKKGSTIYSYALALIHNKLEKDCSELEFGDEVFVKALKESKFTKFKMY